MSTDFVRSYHLFHRIVAAHLRVRNIRLSASDLHDLVHDTLLSYLLSAPLHVQDNQAQSAGWIVTAAYRRVLRNRERDRRFCGLTQESYMLAGEEDQSSTQARIALLTRLVERLTPALHDVFILFLEGYNRAEIAERLGLMLNTVNKRLARARASMQAIALSDADLNTMRQNRHHSSNTPARHPQREETMYQNGELQRSIASRCTR